MIVHQYDNLAYYSGPCDDYNGPMPHGCVRTAPPSLPWNHVWPQLLKNTWKLIPDHRARRVEEGFAPEHVQSPTDYWMPAPFGDDTHQSPARHMTEIGPLPKGHSLTSPQKPLSVAQDEKLREIASAHERALAGAVALSDPTPSTVAIESSLLAVSDAEGLEYVRDQFAARRAELEAHVHAAVSVVQVESIVVSFAV